MIIDADRSLTLVESDGPVHYSVCFPGSVSDVRYVPSVLHNIANLWNEEFSYIINIICNNNIKQLSMWSTNRDFQCEEGYSFSLYNDCSSELQVDYQFSTIFNSVNQLEGRIMHGLFHNFILKTTFESNISTGRWK